MTQTNLPALVATQLPTMANSLSTAVADSQRSVERCTEVGNALLAQIKVCGMSDDLDAQCSGYINKTKKTVKVMVERRSPATKFFDEIRKQFTAMEAQIDPSKSGSVPNQIQQYRDAYAAKKLKEAEAKRQEQLRAQQLQQAISDYRDAVEDRLRNVGNSMIEDALTALETRYNALTLEGVEAFENMLRGLSVELTATIDATTVPARFPIGAKVDRPAIIKEVEAKVMPSIREQYRSELTDYRDSLLASLPATRQELSRIAKLNAEEAAKAQAAREAAQKEAAERAEAERIAKEKKEMAAREMAKMADQANNLFALSAEQHSGTPEMPKASVKKRISLCNQDGILEVLQLWWQHEGKHLPLADLEKTFRKQITFAEKLANDKLDPITIQSENVEYVNEIKAK